MSKFFTVTFPWGADGNIYCTNLIKANSLEAAELYGEREYDMVLSVREINPVEAESYIARHMPFTDLTA